MRAVTFTPGMNKRKLKREVHTNVNESKKGDSKKRFPDVHLKPPTNSERFQKDDNPLLKYSKNKSVKENKVKESFNILQKLGGASMTPSKKDDKFEMFKIPEFKPKKSENPLAKYSFQKEAPINDDQTEEEEKERPPLFPSVRKTTSAPEGIQKRGDKFTQKLPDDFRRNSIAIDKESFKANKKSIAHKRNIYGNKVKFCHYFFRRKRY